MNSEPTTDEIAEARLPSVRVFHGDLQRYKDAAEKAGMSYSQFARLALERAADNPLPLIEMHRELMGRQYAARFKHKH